MCGVITNNMIFATLQLVTSPGSKDLSFIMFQYCR